MAFGLVATCQAVLALWPPALMWSIVSAVGFGLLSVMHLITWRHLRRTTGAARERHPVRG